MAKSDKPSVIGILFFMAILPSIEILNSGKKNNSLLTALEYVNTPRRKKVRCVCFCGQEVVIAVSSFRRANISCGCVFINKNGEIKEKVRYGTGSAILRGVYQSMVDRCYKKSATGYRSYGAKGVSVCKEWLDRPKSFYEWAIDNGWKKGLQVDKDIKGNGKLYSPEMCCIVTPEENNAAIKRVKKFEFNGERMDLKEISRVTGVKYGKLSSRIFAHKMSLSEAISHSPTHKYHSIELDGITYTSKQISEIAGISLSAARYRIKHNFSKGVIFKKHKTWNKR